MVPKKKPEFRFNGYRAPVIPKAPRSIRKREPLKKPVEGNKLCAFELLAAVAGQLLQESDSSTSNNVAEERAHSGAGENGNQKGQFKDDKALKLEKYNHGSCDENPILLEKCSLFSNFKGIPLTETGSVVEHSSVSESSIFPEKDDCDRRFLSSMEENVDRNIKLVISKEENVDSAITSKIDHNVDVKPETQEDDKDKVADLYMTDRSTVMDPSGEVVNTDRQCKLESSVDLPLYRDYIHGALLRKRLNNVNLGIRDDDEKFWTKLRPFQPRSSHAHHRIRKMLKSKYWKIAPKVKDYELCNTREGMRTFNRYRKVDYVQKVCQRAPFKKRKLSDHNFAVAYTKDGCSNSISRKRAARRDESSSSVILHKANEASNSMKGHQKAKDPHVRFCIKSFTLPELYIEVPETATVGALKRTVMEMVTSILRGGIRVGVVLQGKKVRDNNITLQQVSISKGCNLNNLGFTLEPNFDHAPPSKNPEKLPLVLPCDADQQLSRSPAIPVTDSCITHASDDRPLVNKSGNEFIDNELMSSPITSTDALMGIAMPDSKQLVCTPPINVESFAVVKLNPEKRELSQRRTRRPFSAQEVEALVEAVEKLGTGRWRDVKMCAFENEDHRTYVDLKDKWKTLVHTGSIAPQQRRGEPVPQELLNRVLATHSYWSKNQGKQGKQLAEPPKVVVTDMEIEGA